MLILSRKSTETVVIDESIQVTIIRCQRGSVRIGIEAPEGMPILRGELSTDQPPTVEDAE